MRAEQTRDPFDEVVNQLVEAIELRECGDPDGWDFTVDRRIRALERTLLEQYRTRPPRPVAPDIAALSGAGIASRG